LAGLKSDLVLMTSHVAQFFLKDSEWNAMLKAASEALNSGGYILFDSRRSLPESFQKWPTKEARRTVVDPKEGKIEYWVELIETTDKLGRYKLHYFFTETGDQVISEDAIIFRTKEEILSSLENAGFIIETIYGDWDASKYNETSPEMIFLARRN